MGTTFLSYYSLGKAQATDSDLQQKLGDCFHALDDGVSSLQITK
jgi:hypothetical protein